MQKMVSYACRVNDTQLMTWLEDKGAGMHEIPTDVLQPRQVRISAECQVEVPAVLKPHRDGVIPVLRRKDAQCLVDSKIAVWEPQRALVVTVIDYLEDKDVKARPEEIERTISHAARGVNLVLVAIIGESRSPLAVCRNVVSGCQKPERLVDDAKKAMAAANVYLVE